MQQKRDGISKNQHATFGSATNYEMKIDFLCSGVSLEVCRDGRASKMQRRAVLLAVCNGGKKRYTSN